MENTQSASKTPKLKLDFKDSKYATGAEKFAEYIYNKLNEFVDTETEGRVRVTKVKFMEHGKNAACYVE